MPFSELILRLGLAMLFGAIVGIDRQLRRKSAGMRTMMLVALGSATFVLLPLLTMGTDKQPMSSADTSRIIQGIVGGIGFLGAGVVMHSGLRVAGITTAAAIWVTAAVGVAFGLGEFRLACVAGTGTIITLSVVILFEQAIFRNRDGEEEHASMNGTKRPE